MSHRFPRLRYFQHNPSGPHAVQPVIDHVILTGATAGAVGSSIQITATAYDARGNVVQGVGALWYSSETNIATVNASGLVTFTGFGISTITATVDGRAYAVDVTTQISTPTQLVAAINGLTKGQVDGLYIKGINQTIVPDGTSSTGFRCTEWRHAVTNAAGTAWKPTSGFTGAPCLVDGTITDEGLEIPATAGLGTVVADTTVPTLAPGSADCYDGQFGDPTKGRTWGMVSHLTDSVPYLMIGETGTGYLYTGFDQFRYYGIGDQVGAQVAANTLAVHSLTNLKWTDSTGQIAISPGTVRTLNISRLSRDIIHFTVPDTVANSGIPDLSANGAQRLRLLPTSLGGGATVNATTAGVSCVYSVQGRLDGAGTKLLHDFVEAQSWGAGAWNDPLANWVGLPGDSYYDVIQGEHIRIGRVAGAPVLANTRIIPGSSARGSGYAFGGRGVVDYTYPMLGWTARDMDTSRRTGIYVWPEGEFNNAGDSTSTLRANKYVGTTLKAISPKFRRIQRESELGNNDPLTSPAAPMNADLESTFATGGYADLLEKQWYLTPWNTYNYADGAPDKEPVLWKPVSLDGSQHPSDLHQQLIIEFHRLPILSLLGTDISNLSGYVKPTDDHLDLTVGGGTGSTTWTPQTFALTPATGKTLSFTIGTMQNLSGVWTFVAGASVATVNASTGVVTPVAAGQAALVCATNDGALGVCVINVTGSAGPVVNAQFAGSAGLVGNADTGQAPITWAGAWSLDGSGNAYCSTDAGTNKNAFGYDAGVGHADAVIETQLSVADLESGVTWRRSDLDNGFISIAAGDGKLYVFKQVAGSYNSVTYWGAGSQSLWSVANGDIQRITTSGDTHQVDIIRSGSVISTTGVFTDAFNDTVTKHGLRVNTETNVRFAYLTIT